MIALVILALMVGVGVGIGFMGMVAGSRQAAQCQACRRERDDSRATSSTVTNPHNAA